MKSIINLSCKYPATLIILALTIASCGSRSTPANNADTVTDQVASAAVAATPDAPGLVLIKKADCVGCHKQDVKLVGPSYIAIAAKYPDNETSAAMLADKIIRGGKGNWGEIPMTPHPQLSLTDAREMVKYILSLRKK